MKVDEIRVPYYKGIVGACLKNGRIINVKKLRATSDFTESMIVSPVTQKKYSCSPCTKPVWQDYWSLEAINKNTSEGHFTDQDQQLLVSISSHISLAVSSLQGKHKEHDDLVTALKMVKHHHS